MANGESVAKRINQELTYRDLYDNADNLWSVLFMTGYLTQCSTADGKKEEGTGIVIEIKYPDAGDLDKGCREALEQIERKGYDAALRQDGSPPLTE